MRPSVDFKHYMKIIDIISYYFYHYISYKQQEIWHQPVVSLFISLFQPKTFLPLLYLYFEQLHNIKECS